MLSRLRTVTAADCVPRHCGIHFAARSPMRRSPSSCAIPTSVLVTDFVTEKTSCAVFGPVPRKYHSPASLPSRTTTRQFDLPLLACAAISFSFAASSPTAAGATFCHSAPGCAALVAHVSAGASSAKQIATARHIGRLPFATSTGRYPRTPYSEGR